jgi:uncharacterized ferritin-like protein (DUF455 family)
MQLDSNKSILNMCSTLQSYNWESREAYAQYLAQTYYFVSHSTRLLAASAARFSQAETKMHRRFLKHTEEENSHEVMALRDLQNLGYKIEDFPELPETRLLYEPQYFKVEHLDPLALMGYILALEVLAYKECPPLKSFLTDRYGAKCTVFIKVHADDDPDHVEKAMELIQGLPEHRLNMIMENLEQTSIAYVSMIKACKQVAMKVKKAA